MGEKEREPRDLTGSPLSLTFGQTLLPLVAVRAEEEKYSRQAALALEMAGRLPTNAVFARGHSSSMVVIALVQTRAVHFMRVALSRSGKRGVAGVTSFLPPVLERAASRESALFTD
jgi:hypothetical protein